MCLSPWQIFHGYELIIMSSCHIGMMSVLINLFYRPVFVCLVVGSVTLTLCHPLFEEFFCNLVVWHIVMWITLWKKALTLTYILRKFLMLKCCHFLRVGNKGDFALSSEQNPKIILKKVKKTLDFVIYSVYIMVWIIWLLLLVCIFI